MPDTAHRPLHVFCIGDADTVRGFRLAGVRGRVAEDATTAARAFDTAAADRECGILIVSDAVAVAIRARLDAHRESHAQPLIVEIPGPGASRGQRRDWQQLVQEAVGMSLSVGEDSA